MSTLFARVDIHILWWTIWYYGTKVSLLLPHWLNTSKQDYSLSWWIQVVPFHCNPSGLVMLIWQMHWQINSSFNSYKWTWFSQIAQLTWWDTLHMNLISHLLFITFLSPSRLSTRNYHIRQAFPPSFLKFPQAYRCMPCILLYC